MGNRSRRRRPGFTLVELGVVILIIGILMSFLLVAAWEGLERANERATQSLILKLDTAIADRIEALSTQRPEANNAHRLLALTLAIPGSSAQSHKFVESEPRARLIAKIDYLKRELPDVFFVQADSNYPLNFAGMPFKPGAMTPNPGMSARPDAMPGLANYLPYILPLGNAMQINLQYDASDRSFNPGVTQLCNLNGLTSTVVRFNSPPAGEGIFGASYSAMGSLTRLLGYPPRGYNGVDDDGNGLIDEFTIDEFYPPNQSDRSTLFQQLQVEIQAKLSSHQHITARSEMLYAILVSGVGPLGSAFSPDDFTDREVRDTDGDGLPEFVDAWGKPLQFYRWPSYFVSDYGAPARGLQKGDAAYAGLTEPREDSPLDPNRLLIAPSWWTNMVALTSGNMSGDSSDMSDRANLFQQQFFSLVDPYADVSAQYPGFHYDRTSFFKYRTYFFKHLILSAGPDGQYGVGSYGLTYSDGGQTVVPGRPPSQWYTPAEAASFAARMILVENQAARSDARARTDGPNAQPGNAGGSGGQPINNALQVGRMHLYQLPSPPPLATPDASIDATPLLRLSWGVDDLSNHTVTSTGSGGR